MPWDPAPATTACQPSGSAARAEGRDLQVAVAEFCACAPCLLRKIAPQSVRLVCRWDDGDKQSIHRPVGTRSYGTRGSQGTGADPWVAIHPTAWRDCLESPDGHQTGATEANIEGQGDRIFALQASDLASLTPLQPTFQTVSLRGCVNRGGSRTLSEIAELAGLESLQY